MIAFAHPFPMLYSIFFNVVPESSPIDDVVVPIDDDMEEDYEEGKLGLYEVCVQPSFPT